MFALPYTDTLLITLLAQDGGNATLGPTTPGQENTENQLVDGSTTSTGTNQTSTNPFGGGFLMIMVGMFAVMIIFSQFSGRKQKKKRTAMLDSLKKHDQVLTRGGVFGSIIEVKSDRVVLKVDESSNTRITVLRDSIEQITVDSTGV